MNFKFKINDNVVDPRFDHYGTIDRIFKNFFDYSANGTFLTTGDGLTWLAEQEHRYTQDELLMPWYHVVCFGGGTIVVCERYLEKQN